MKKALLLGASGYLGSVLYEILNRRGWEVTGTCRGRCGQRHVPLDVTDRERLAALIGRERPGAIVWSLMSGTDEARLIRAGLGGLLALIEPATRFVFVSTDGVFPGNRGNYSEADATAYWQAGHELAAYCSAKLDGERIGCRRPALRQGNRSEWMRCGSMRRTAPAWIRKRKKDGRRSV
ncbi:NAD-dependent epimerase/dehydratase family protein [Brevibacillus thermoruber]|jgi:dTDP-4-dehydrorhamnose reductase|uniref:NAD-dependent epimerase/dehydratase family protein n=1 Tax=Brevibacillus thermoruber TaxID=33942 RepID=UPI00068F72AF|nr:NAD-dependent epimerase/dehydratase family protein [Brevibacillus thermoruber]